MSNPQYDYTKNEYYQNNVNLGNDAVSVLEDKTKCDLQKKYNLEWSIANKFYTLWQENNCLFKK